MMYCIYLRSIPPCLLLVMIISLLIWPSSTGKTTLHQAIAQNSTMAIYTAKLLAGDAIQALGHKDLNGALEHLKLIVQKLGIRGNSTSNLNSKFVSHTHIHIPGINSQQSVLLSTHVFQNVLGKTVPNPTHHLVSCISSNPTVQTFNNAVPIPSDPGSGLVSTRVLQMVSKAVPNPTNHISCIPSTFAIQMLGKTVLNPTNHGPCAPAIIIQTLSSGVSNPTNHGPCVASNLIIQTPPNQNSGLVSTHVIQAPSNQNNGAMSAPVINTLSSGLPNPSNQNSGAMSSPVIHTATSGLANPSNQNSGAMSSPVIHTATSGLANPSNQNTGTVSSPVTQTITTMHH
jgi:hypothetical protein